MKIINRKRKIMGKINFAAFIMTMIILSGINAMGGYPELPVGLGNAGNFAILSKSGISTVSGSQVVGDMGVSPIDSTAITGFSLILDGSGTFSTSTQVTGEIYASDYAAPTPFILTTSVSDMETAYTDAAGRTLPDHTELGAGDISGMTLAPGLYKWGTSVLINSDVTIAGGPNDVWIFQIAGNLTAASAKSVILSGGAQAKNIFWQVAGGVGVEIGTTAHVEGIILAQAAITLQTGASLNGRLFAQTAVTLQSNAVTEPADQILVSKINASNGTRRDGVMLDWALVKGATHYKIYRSTSLTGTKVFSSWYAGNSFLDSSALPGITYYYWVTAATSSTGEGESNFSVPDEGYVAASNAVLTPVIDASDGSRYGGIALKWPAVTGATHYKVYRSANEDGTGMASSGWITGTYVFDGSISSGQTYYYWVKAATSVNGANASGLSDHDTGYAANPEAILTPAYINASDGTRSDGIALNWPSVTGATHYRVYRSKTEFGTKVYSSWFGGTSLLDNTAESGQSYFYWVQSATSSSGAYASGFSGSDTGYYRSAASSQELNSVSVTENIYSDNVISSWTSESETSPIDKALTSLIDPYEPSDISVQFDCTQYLSDWGMIRLSDIGGCSEISSLDDVDYYKVFLSPGWYDVEIECDILNWSPLSVMLYNSYGEVIDSVNNEELAPLVIDTDLYVSESGYYYIGIHPWSKANLPTTEYPVKYDLDIKFLRW